MSVIEALKGLFLKSSPAPPEAIKDAPADAASTSTRWVSSTKEARESIKWLATSVGAAAAVAFGAGPILISPKLDISGWTWLQYTAYFSAGVLAAVGVVSVVWCLLLSLVPEELTLHDLPKTFVTNIDKHPLDSGNDRFPTGIDSLDDLRSYMLGARHAMVTLRRSAAAENEPVQKKKLENAAENLRQSYTVCREYEAELLDQAAYFVTRERIRNLRGPVLGGTVLVLVGVSLYLLVVSEGANVQAGSSAEVATLVQSSGPAGEQLWDTLDLSSCESEPGVVPVLLTGGKGTPVDPYTVRTIPILATCPDLSFNVISPVAEVVRFQATKHTIEYSETPPE